MTFKQDIEKIIDSNLKTYRDNSDRFIADYNREQELTKEYNGRQLLELLQNADDADSSEVEIVWDKESAKLIISNSGEAFSVGGIKSLMLANLSTKTKISYIGNKGLGFRSILNWAEHIQIYSNNCKIIFSETIAKDIFENQLGLNETERKELLDKRNLTQSAVPFPTLAIPKVDDFEDNSQWATTIEILCKREFENDIENQLSEIREELLLFLNTIQKITIRSKEGEILNLESDKEIDNDYDIVKIKNKCWKVFTKESLLPEELQDKSKNEQQCYSLKVAFQDDLSDDYNKLFNFFPTQLSISLPCIIHGTFELNSSRNYLNESKKNEYILKELVQLLRKCSLFLTNENVDWRPYEILTPTAGLDSKLIRHFYSELEDVKNMECIYPCINNQYKILEETRYYNDEFSDFFKKNFSNILPELLIRLSHKIKDCFSGNKFKHEELVERIDELSYSNLSIPLRAELIYQLSKIISYKEENERFSLLVNESKVISKDDLTFTPKVRSEAKFEIPDLVKVYFMKPELYDLLILKFKETFDKKELEARELQRAIKSVVNLQPYDSNNVIEKIVTGTRGALSSLSADDKISCIKDMVTALFVNFKNIENRQEKLKVKVPLISAANKIVDAENLFLSKTYPSGMLTELIYEGLFCESDYLVPLDSWRFEDEDKDLIESFFIWIGVNKYVKVISVDLHDYRFGEEYLNYIFYNGTEKPIFFEFNRIQKNSLVSKIDKFDYIEKLAVNKLILLVLKDSFIRKQIENNDEKINWSYAKSHRTIVANYSYVRYQFLNSNIFSKFILEDGGEDLNNLINEDFDIDYKFLESFGINKSEVKSILIKLGAKESFNDVLPENIYDILKALPIKDASKKGKATQKVYKMALDSLVKQEYKIKVPEDLVLFAKKGTVEEYKLSTDIYYSDNNILPKKIQDTLYMLNLPKRIGEDNVEKYFGVKSLKDFKIQINDKGIKENYFNSEFNKCFESLKPYLLACRLSSSNLKKKISELDTKKKEANAIKQCRIKLVDECVFDFDGKVNLPIEQKEYINIKDIFYYKDNSVLSIDALKRDSFFCDAFAEMMCITFKVNDLKNEFRQILKNDLMDTIHLAIQDMGKDKIDEAFQLLGISRVEFNFWKNVFQLKKLQLIEPIENNDVLKQEIQNKLDITLLDEYVNVDFEKFDNKESFQFIKELSNKLCLSVKEITQFDIYNCGLYNWHKIQLVDVQKDYEFKFKLLLWLKLKDKPEEQQNFISNLNKYNFLINDCEENIISKKFELDVEYSEILKDSIYKLFSININGEFDENNLIDNLYTGLLNKYSVEYADVTDEAIRSLLFFENNSNRIELYLKSHFGLKEENDLNMTSKDANLIGTIVDASLSKTSRIRSFNFSENESNSWIHSGQSDKSKKYKGKKAELLVYNTLKAQYGLENVIWVSGYSNSPNKNDKLHYDIKYKNNDDEWKYLEVKAMSDNQFIISSPEKIKGIENPDRFELALVAGETIYLVKDLFKFEQGESFENNSKFVAYPKDYVFSFKVNALNSD